VNAKSKFIPSVLMTLLGGTAAFLAVGQVHAALVTIVKDGGAPETCTMDSISVAASGDAKVVVHCSPVGSTTTTVSSSTTTTTTVLSTTTTTIPPNVVQFNLASAYTVYSDRTFVPGCINGQDWGHTSCEYEGNARYGMIYSGKFTLAARSKKIMSLLQAQAGENFGMFSGAISTTGRGDLNGADGDCRFTESVSPYLTIADQAYVDSLGPPVTRWGYTYDPAAGICVVPADAPIYMNITPAGPGAEQCGTGKICRTQIIEGSPNYAQ
jgi:hypothetical protein